MRVLWVILSLLYTTALVAQTDYASFQNRSLSLLLQKIESNHKVQFSYSDRNVADYSVSIPSGMYTVDEILEIISLQTQLTFEMIDKTHILIIPNKEEKSRMVCGYVHDHLTKEPLPFASVYVHESSHGVETDETGYFEIIIKNEDQLGVSFLGYEDTELNSLLSIDGDCPIYTCIQNNEIAEIVVTEYLFDGIRQDDDAHDIVIEPDNLNIMPGSVENDVLSAIQFLPGIYSTSESLDEIHIRGGTPDQNLILWDGIPVYHTSHFFGNISAFNPFVIDDVNVHRSAIASEYGGRVSGVIDITSRDSIPKEFDIGLNVNMTHLGLQTEIPLWDNAGIIFSSRGSLTPEIALPTFNNYAEKVFQGTKLEDSDFDNPDLELSDEFSFNDGSFKFIYTPGKNKFVLSTIGGLNKLDYYSDVPNYNAYSVDNLNLKNGGASLLWERIWTDKLTSQLEFTNSYYRYDYSLTFNLIDQDVDPPVQYTSYNQINDDGAKLNFDYKFSEEQNIKFGFQSTDNLINLEIGKKEFGIEEMNTQENSNRLASLYGEYELAVANILKLDMGLRYQYHTFIKENYFEPRIALVTDVTENIKLKASTSKQFQFISQLIYLDINDLNLSNQVWIASNNTTVPVIESNQWTGGIVYTNGSWTLDAEGYVKELAGITGQPFTPAIGVGTTTSNGMEIPIIQYDAINSNRLDDYFRLDGSVSYHFGNVNGYHGNIVFAIQNMSNRSNIHGKSFILDPSDNSGALPDIVEVQQRGLKWTPNIGVNMWW